MVDGKRLRAVRDRYKMTQVQMARALAVTANTLARYERGVLRIPGPVARLVELIDAEVIPADDYVVSTMIEVVIRRRRGMRRVARG